MDGFSTAVDFGAVKRSTRCLWTSGSYSVCDVGGLARMSATFGSLPLSFSTSLLTTNREKPSTTLSVARFAATSAARRYGTFLVLDTSKAATAMKTSTITTMQRRSVYVRGGGAPGFNRWRA